MTKQEKELLVISLKIWLFSSLVAVLFLGLPYLAYRLGLLGWPF